MKKLLIVIISCCVIDCCAILKSELENGGALRTAGRKLLEDLPQLHYNTFVYVLAFIREILVETTSNRADVSMLAAWCLNCMTAVGGSGTITTTATGATASSSTSSNNNNSSFGMGSDGSNKWEKEKEKRVARQSYLLSLLSHLLTTPVL